MYIPGPGFSPTRRSSSKSAKHQLPGIFPRASSTVDAASAAGPTKPSSPPPTAVASHGPARRWSGAVFPRRLLSVKDVSSPVVAAAVDEDGLSPSLTENSSPAEASRRLSSHAKGSLRLIAGADACGEVSALSPYTSLNLVMFAAYGTLRLLLLPLWRRYRYRKQLARATATVAKFIVAKVHARRRRQERRAANAILRLLRAPRTRLLSVAHELEMRVVCIQRAYRLHRRSVQAVVELNYRKVRRDEEKEYWAKVVAQREAELAEQPPPTGAVAKAIQEVLEAKRAIHTRFDAFKHASTVSPASAPAAPVPSRYELDVYNYYMIGRLPETMLRLEITSAVFAHTRRSAERACLLDDLCVPRHKKRTDARCVADRVSAAAAAAAAAVAAPKSTAMTKKAKCGASLPHFLPKSVYTSILNNTCYTTSLMRNDAMLRAHLKPRNSSLEPY
ncbi:hypothetical protein ABB37_04940 [Leptomonas pyrrhocoris]|uniref:Uncharacterized protein n=1 Tax=Leptomonas pyrrhocoris TaxID=157538 RepID=A0A0N0DV46_LEPPY|nr:hypothetical protein ABB37_04940 [Leptomonas pyrrhocoris]XP_015658301.1 hypothetical protein ABB37_04940 [Leptomonas pyrrhocoris]KPA79861.1 hypothetical protein ABB37_04940 [Leptomonas pyrrhocoris]KPA79862.1 hypothetical protein ABB37_04940 [Leptomonas pyrrhocoris]|eukprot:XP_015658300.1 hypothetical protein ABB37_04940 [Leptomonas pyrrhocoris]